MGLSNDPEILARRNRYSKNLVDLMSLPELGLLRIFNWPKATQGVLTNSGPHGNKNLNTMRLNWRRFIAEMDSFFINLLAKHTPRLLSPKLPKVGRNH